MSRFVATVVFGILAPTVSAQAVQLVKDINVMPVTDPSSDPEDVVSFQGRAVFEARTTENTSLRIGVWSSDGTEAGTYQIDNVGANEIVATPNLVFLMTGSRLSVSDGTEGNSAIIRNLSGQFSNARDMVALGNDVYFASGGSQSRNLMKSDGTSIGTVVVKNWSLGSSAMNSPAVLTPVGNELFFAARDVGSGLELWKSDGTPAGTVLVKEIRPGASGSNITEGLGVNGLFFFSADDGIGGQEPFVSDGTPTGTLSLGDLRPGPADSGPTGFCGVGSTVFFTADDGINGRELWKSDGTPGGTAMVSNVRAGMAPSNPSDLVALGGEVYFVADDGISGRELWKSDGTAVGTVLVADLAPGAASSSPSGLAVRHGAIYFAADDGANGVEPYVSDGTTVGTISLGDLQPGGGNASPGSFTELAGNAVFFDADDGSTGIEPYVTDGLPGGTGQVLNLNATTENQGSLPSDLVDYAGIALFAADDGVVGRELWRTDGSDAGTWLVADINPGGDGNPRELVVAGGLVFFHADDGATGDELWVSDGTTLGTRRVADIEPGPDHSLIRGLTRVGTRVFFAATTIARGEELWCSDGTPGGTHLVADLEAGVGSSSPAWIVDFRGDAMFAATTAATGIELWISDGTTQGTQLVRDIQPGPVGSLVRLLTPLEGLVYFEADAQGFGREVWVSDGTPSGTYLVDDVGGPSDSISEFYAMGETMFVLRDTTSWAQLWRIDDPSAGMTLVLSTLLGFGAGHITPVEGGFVFGLYNDQDVLYFSDGTTNGTSVISWHCPQPSGISSAGTRRAMFSDGRPWVTDGTTLGTVPLTGFSMSMPATVLATAPLGRYFTMSSGLALFAATEVELGSELFSWYPGATATSYGVGCSRDLRPTLRVSDPVLGDVWQMSGTAPLGTSGVLLLGVPAPGIAFPGSPECELYVQAPVLVLAPFAAAAGAWAFGVPLPDDPAFVGADLALQAATVPSTSPRGFDLSNGSFVELGF